MDAQSVMIASRLARIAEMRGEIARLREENSRLQAENAALRSHAALGVLALGDLASLAPGARMVLVDGWNLILGAGGGETVLGGRVHSPAALIAQAGTYLAAHENDFVWLVFDGREENAQETARLRVSYTGGEGAQRADRFIVDFVRAAFFRSLSSRIAVLTHDKKLLKEARRLGAALLS